MIELGILIVFLPLSLLSFQKIAKFRAWVLGLALLMGFASNLYLLFIKSTEPSVWLPVIALFGMVLFQHFLVRQLNFLSALGVFFLAQALLTYDFPIMLLLLFFADVLFCGEFYIEAAADEAKDISLVHSFLKMLVSYAPAFVGVLLGLSGVSLAVATSITIAMRLFSWPVSNWVANLKDYDTELIQSLQVVFVFVLWRSQASGLPSYWILVWPTIAIIMSLGAPFLQVSSVFVLGLFSISPIWGALAFVVWPLMIRWGASFYFHEIIILATGGLIFNFAQTQNLFPDEALWVWAGFAALLIVRSALFIKVEKAKPSEEVLKILFGSALLAAAVYLMGLSLPQPNIALWVFLSSALVFLGLGLGVKPLARFIKPLAPWERPKVSLPQIAEPEGTRSKYFERYSVGKEQKIFDLLFTEPALVSLLGLLALYMLWGAK